MKERAKEQQGPRRGEWLFSYPVGDVLNGALKRLREHTDRESFWQEEREKAVAAVKNAGFEVREYEVTGGKDVQVVVDTTLTGRLQQCGHKLREHKVKVKEFKQWVAVMSSQNKNEHIDLNMDDALYFGIAQQEPEE